MGFAWPLTNTKEGCEAGLKMEADIRGAAQQSSPLVSPLVLESNLGNLGSPLQVTPKMDYSEFFHSQELVDLNNEPPQAVIFQLHICLPFIQLADTALGAS